MVIDEARKLIDDLSFPKQVVVMLAALCHDLGKPLTTQILNGRLRSLGHEEAGVAPTESFLDRLGLHSLDGYPVRQQIIQIVRHHLKPAQFFRVQESISDGALRRLAREVETDLLCEFLLPIALDGDQIGFQWIAGQTMMLKNGFQLK